MLGAGGTGFCSLLPAPRSPLSALCLLFAALFAPASTASAALTHHWKLDETTGTTAVATVGTDGAYARDASNTTAAGPPGGGIPKSQDLVTGSSDFVNISAASISFASGPHSFSAWLRTDSGIMRVCGQAATQNNGMIIWSGTTLQFRTNGPASFTVPTLDGNWHHVVVTRDGSNNARCYIDGTESSTGAVSRIGTWAPTRLGFVFSHYHDGPIAQVRIYDHALDQTEVDALFAEASGGGGGGNGGAAHYYYQQQSARERDRKQFFAAIGLDSCSLDGARRSALGAR